MRWLVDIRPVLDEYSRCSSLYPLYQKMPLREIVTGILSYPTYACADRLWEEVANRFPDDELDYDTIEIFFETLTEAVDDCIMEKVPDILEQDGFILERWVDGSTCMLKPAGT